MSLFGSFVCKRMNFYQVSLVSPDLYVRYCAVCATYDRLEYQVQTIVHNESCNNIQTNLYIFNFLLSLPIYNDGL